jgi:hypothetical protein
MSKIPPQLSELVLETFHQFKFFAKHQILPKSIIERRIITADGKRNKETSWIKRFFWESGSLGARNALVKKE